MPKRLMAVKGLPSTLHPDVTGCNVKHYGAVGDGVTDDTDAIQDAMDACTEVYIPDGVYMIRHDAQTMGWCQVGLLAKAGLKMVLASGATLRMIPHAGDWTAVIGVNVGSVEISGGTIEGDKAGHTLGSPVEENCHCIILFSGTTNAHIHDITLQYAQGDGIMCIGSTTPSNILIDNIVSQLNFRHGIGVDGLVDSVISNSTFDSNSGEGWGCGIDLEATVIYSSPISGITLTDNVFSNNEAHGLILIGEGSLLSDITVDGNEFFGNHTGTTIWASGFSVWMSVDRATNITFQNNNSHDNLDPGVRFENADSCSCINNTATDNTDYGFFFFNCINSQITGNTATGNTDDCDINVNCVGTTATDNSFPDFP